MAALNGTSGDDILVNTLGDDVFDGKAGSDTVSYAATNRSVIVDLNVHGIQNTGDPTLFLGSGSDTFVSIENVVGSGSFDYLFGDDRNNRLYGGDGGDTLQGAGGDDLLDGGAGIDTASYSRAVSAVTVSLALSGPQDTHGAGVDTLVSIENLDGSAFADVLTGNSQDNRINGGAGDDLMFATLGMDYLDGGAGDDTVSFANLPGPVTGGGYYIGLSDHTSLISVENLIGTALGDDLSGGSGANHLYGAGGDDVLDGGDGDDTLVGGAGNDWLRGGEGHDTAVFSGARAAYTISLRPTDLQIIVAGPDGTDVLGSIERLQFADQTIDTPSVASLLPPLPSVTNTSVTLTMTGSYGFSMTAFSLYDLANATITSNSTTQITGSTPYTSYVVTGTFAPSLPGYWPASGTVRTFSMTQSGGGVSITGASLDATQFRNFVLNDDWAGLSASVLTGADHITGNSGSNGLIGFGGNDILDGGAGDDNLYGGPGNDILIGGAGTDQATYDDACGALTIDLRLVGAQDTGGGGIDTLSGIENLTGGLFNDRLTGTSGSNFIDGGGGDDILDGQGSSSLVGDHLWGGAGDDILIGRDGANVLNGWDGYDTLDYSQLSTGIQAGLQSGTVTHGGNTDYVDGEYLIATSQADTISGGQNTLRIDGGAGDDIISSGGSSSIAIDAGAGNDQVSLTYVNYARITLGPGADTFTPIWDSVDKDIHVTDFSAGDLITMTADVNTWFASGVRRMAQIGNDVHFQAASSTPGQFLDFFVLDNVQITSLGASSFAGGPAPVAWLVGGPGADTLTGGATTRLDGGLGDDLVISTNRSETLSGGPGVDTVSYASATSGVTVSLALATTQATGDGSDTLSLFENLTGSAFNDVLTGDGGNNILTGGLGNDTLNGGGGTDAASYASASTGVHVSLGVSGPQDTGGAGTDTLNSIEDLFGSAYSDVLTGNAGPNLLDGGAGVDTVIFSGPMSAYTIETFGATATVFGAEGTDTLVNVEYLQFSDQTFHFRPGTAATVDFTASPSTYAGALRDFDGNDLGGAGSWVLAGHVDIQGDGDQEYILFNSQIGRWATIGPAADGRVYFDDHGWAGDTRVVGIYIDPEVVADPSKAGGPFDSQRRFQNDLNIGNLKGILGAGDYNHDGLQEVYFSLTDGTAYLHAYMHADGNIQYANYQSQQQVIDYLTANGFSHTTWDGWF